MSKERTSNNGYEVIGGQYAPYYYGHCDTLIGAKRLATKNKEYWDNWQGWQKPRIYRSEDTRLGASRYDGSDIRVPRDWAIPIA